ncbi:hypothetical protein ACQ4PT_032088 [Festuca glaucescens]
MGPHGPPCRARGGPGTRIFQPAHLFFLHASPTSSPPLRKQARIRHRIRLAAEVSEVPMAAKYIIGSLVGSCVIAYACDYIVSQKKIFGGTIPGTVSDKEWWQATDMKFQAWPRTAGPPVVMNPISRQNFIVKDL